MAFVKHDEWEISSGDAQFDRRGAATVFLPIAAGSSWLRSRSAGALISLMVNGIVLWLVLTETIVPRPPRLDSVLRLIDLTPAPQPEAPAQESGAAGPIAPSPPVVAPDQVDTTAARLPSEWSVSSVKVVTAPTASASAPASVGGVGSGTASGTGQGSGGGYDPYAGAAPLAGGPQYSSVGNGVGGAASLTGATGQGFSFDEAQFDAAREAVGQAFPGVHGEVQFVVRASPTGMILDLRVETSTLPKAVIDKLHAMLVGRGMLRMESAGGGVRQFRLPLLTL